MITDVLYANSHVCRSTTRIAPMENGTAQTCA